MSHISKIEYMKIAKKQGFEVNLLFIATDDVQINLDRVEKRVREGGHEVPPDKTVSRYHRILPGTMSLAVKEAHHATIYDSTKESKRVLLIDNTTKTVTVLEPLSQWIEKHLMPVIYDYNFQISTNIELVDKQQEIKQSLQKALSK